MRTLISSLLVSTAILSTGCNQKDASSGGSTQPSGATNQPTAQIVASNAAKMAGTQMTTVASTPVIQPILTTWQEGHTANAVDQFVRADWNARPIFPSGMVLGFTDAQFQAIPGPDRPLKQHELETQLGLIEQLATEVGNTGREAVSKGDATRARQCYTALKQFGTALDSPDGQPVMKRTGQVCKTMADLGLAKIH